jgi:hypothetical protein
MQNHRYNYIFVYFNFYFCRLIVAVSIVIVIIIIIIILSSLSTYCSGSTDSPPLSTSFNIPSTLWFIVQNVFRQSVNFSSFHMLNELVLFTVFPQLLLLLLSLLVYVCVVYLKTLTLSQGARGSIFG